jgi:hypothetical protein
MSQPSFEEDFLFHNSPKKQTWCHKYTPTLQKAMGHSSINVSLAYLRGLDAAELKEVDMPLVYYWLQLFVKLGLVCVQEFLSLKLQQFVTLLTSQALRSWLKEDA